MANFNSLSEHGQKYIIMAVNDLIKENLKVKDGAGLYVGKHWLTPESCYWLYKLLSQEAESCLVSSDVLSALKRGCNCPDLI